MECFDVTAIQSKEGCTPSFRLKDTDSGVLGKLTAILDVYVPKGTLARMLDKAVFSARKGELGGPIKTQFGYYVVDIDKITKGNQQTLAQATPTIKQVLTQQAQQKAVSDFSETYRKKWTKVTDCRKGYTIQGCKNGPKATTTAAGTSATTTPQQ